MNQFSKRGDVIFRRIVCLFVLVSFIFTLILPPQKADAQAVLDLPAAGAMVSLSPDFQPALIKGLTIHKDNPFLFDFIVDPGQEHAISKQSLKEQGDRMVKYFFATLTLPEKDIWVNLSPSDRAKRF